MSGCETTEMAREVFDSPPPLIALRLCRAYSTLQSSVRTSKPHIRTLPSPSHLTSLHSHQIREEAGAPRVDTSHAEYPARDPLRMHAAVSVWRWKVLGGGASAGVVWYGIV